MIIPFDDHKEKKTKPPTPRSLLLSIERELGKAGKVASRNAHKAQELVYDAWDADSYEEQMELIYQAFELDPTNVDALLSVIDDHGIKGEEKIDALHKIVAMGEKNLGPKVFKEDKGHFWGCIETRPYMRARADLAETLRQEGRFDEAIVEFEAMLELNPNDNQGLRYTLLGLYFMLKELIKIQDLFSKYNECQFNAVFAWGRVLERFLSGDLPEAVKALGVARKQNPHTQAYVRGHRQLPRNLPDAYAPGSKDEAVCYAEVLYSMWARYPQALKWLSDQK